LGPRCSRRDPLARPAWPCCSTATWPAVLRTRAGSTTTS